MFNRFSIDSGGNDAGVSDKGMVVIRRTVSKGASVAVATLVLAAATLVPLLITTNVASAATTHHGKHQSIGAPMAQLGAIPGTYVVAAAATSRLAVQYSIVRAKSTPGCAVVKPGLLKMTGSGLCIVELRQRGNAMWQSAQPVFVAVTITAGAIKSAVVGFAPQTITPTPTGPQVSYQELMSMSATASSNLPVGYAIDTTSTAPGCEVTNTGTVSATGPGTCYVITTQAGNATYSPAPTVLEKVLFGGQLQLPTVTSVPASGAWPGKVSVSASVPSGLPVVYSIDSASTAQGCAVTTAGVVRATGVGDCVIYMSAPGNAQFAPASLSPVVQVTITSDPTAGLTFSAQMYQAIYLAGALPLAVDWTNPLPLAVGATSGSPVTYSISTGPTTLPVANPMPTGPMAPGCAVTTAGVVTTRAPGTCEVQVAQVGSALFAPTDEIVIVNFAAAQTINGLAVSVARTRILSRTSARGIRFLVHATASSGLPVKLSIGAASTERGCTVTGTGVVTATGSLGGVCVVYANQPGNVRWLPARQVSVSVRFVAAR